MRQEDGTCQGQVGCMGNREGRSRTRRALVQALHAGGKVGDAKTLLKNIETHPDGDVRTIADNVLYIYQVTGRF